MDFALMSCPYCGRTVDSSDPSRYVCESCGKIILANRTDVFAFIRPEASADLVREGLTAVFDDNPKKALDIANGLIDQAGCCNHDPYFLRGYIYAVAGEDGKAVADWKKGMELLSNDVDLDSYICLMCEGISRMLLYKEREYIEFNVVSYVDRLTEDIDSCTGMSCRAFVYYTIYLDCVGMIETLPGSDGDFLRDVIPELFRRVVAYHRNYWCLVRVIDEYLDFIGYDAVTYVDDENQTPHVYDLVRNDLRAHIVNMTEADRLRIFDRWDDKSLRENIEPLLDTMVGKRGLLGKLRSKDGFKEQAVDIGVQLYVDKCLLIDGPEEEPVPPEAPAESEEPPQQ